MENNDEQYRITRTNAIKVVNKSITEIINENFYSDCFYFVDLMYIPTVKKLTSLVKNALLLDININDEIRTVIIVKKTIPDEEKKILRMQFAYWWYIMMDSIRFDMIKERYLPGGGAMCGQNQRWLAFDAKNGCNGKIMSVNIPDDPALRAEFNKKYQLTHTLSRSQEIHLAGVRMNCSYHVIDDMKVIRPWQEN